MRFILTVGSLLLLPILLTAQDVRHDFRIEFAQGSHNVDKSIKENAETIDELLSTLRNAQNRPDEKLLGIGFSGSVSPEGSVRLNLRLSRSRLASTESYIRERFQIPDSIITRRDLFIDWPLLDSLVQEEKGIALKDSILEVLHSGKSDESKIETLRSLGSGSAWNDMSERVFPKMRRSDVTIVITSRIGNLQRIRSLETDLSDGGATAERTLGLTPPLFRYNRL